MDGQGAELSIDIRMSIYFLQGKSYRRPNFTHGFSYQTDSRIILPMDIGTPYFLHFTTASFFTKKRTHTMTLLGKNLQGTNFATTNAISVARVYYFQCIDQLPLMFKYNFDIVEDILTYAKEFHGMKD